MTTAQIGSSSRNWTRSRGDRRGTKCQSGKAGSNARLAVSPPVTMPIPRRFSFRITGVSSSAIRRLTQPMGSRCIPYRPVFSGALFIFTSGLPSRPVNGYSKHGPSIQIPSIRAPRSSKGSGWASGSLPLRNCRMDRNISSASSRGSFPSAPKKKKNLYRTLPPSSKYRPGSSSPPPASRFFAASRHSANNAP